MPLHDFERSRRSFDRQFRLMNIVFWIIFSAAILSIPAVGYMAYKAGCFQSMVLNGVCLSDPTLDGAMKKVLGR